MFCSNCGRKLSEAHRYCGACGTKVEFEPTPMGSSRVASDSGPGDWINSIDYKTVLTHPDVQKLIARATGTNPGGMSAEEFLSSASVLYKIAGVKGVPLKLIADVGPGLYSKMGIKTGKDQEQDFAIPPGRAIAAVLCALASRNQTLTEGVQAADGCALKAKLPSSVWSFTGEITVTIERRGEGCLVLGNVTVPGQMLDWGKSAQTLRELFGDIPRFVSLQG